MPIRDTKEDQRTSLPSWIGGESDKDIIHTRNQSPIQTISNTRRKPDNGDRIGRGGRAIGSSGFLEKEYKPGNRDGSGRKSGSVEKQIDFHFTMQQLRDSLTDEQLTRLLRGSYISHDMVTIKKANISSNLPEDFFRRDNIKKVRKVRIPTVTIPSMFYSKEVEEYKACGKTSAEAAVGIYFRLYKKLFHEEDAMWSGVKPSKALDIMKSFGNLIIDNQYDKAIAFTKKILPLWKDRLLKESKFPNTRPTFYKLYDGNRHFWLNRNIYYKQWSNIGV